MAANRLLVYLSDSTMEPRYPKDTPIFVDRVRKPVPGDDVLVRLRTGQALVRCLLAASQTMITVGCIAAGYPQVNIAADLVADLLRVIPLNELIGP